MARSGRGIPAHCRGVARLPGRGGEDAFLPPEGGVRRPGRGLSAGRPRHIPFRVLPPLLLLLLLSPPALAQKGGPVSGIPDLPDTTRKGPGLQRSAADSLRRALEPDSLRAKNDSLRRLAAIGHRWRESRLRDAREDAWLGITRDAASLTRFPESQLREILPWELPLERMPSGTYNTPDVVDAGDLPGREPAAVMLEGTPLAPAGMPETAPDAVQPFWLTSVRLRPADPLTLPGNPTGGPLLEYTLAEPDSNRAVTGAHLIQGTNNTYSEEFILCRPGTAGLLRAFYGDHKTSGRDIYGGQHGQNLLVRFDRGEKRGGWRLNWQQSNNHVRVLELGRFLWDYSTIDGGAVLRRGRWTGDLSLGSTWEHEQWEGAPFPSDRKTALTRSLLKVRGPEGSFRPSLTAQLDFQRVRYGQPGILSLDRRHTGLSLAAGGDLVSRIWRFRGSAGLSTPAAKRSGWVAALDADRLFGGIGFRAHADHSVRAPLLPRLANDFGVLTGQALSVPVPDPSRPLEEVLRLESGLSFGEGVPVPARREEVGAVGFSTRPANGLQVTARFVEVRHAVVPEEGELAAMQEEAYWSGLFPRDALDRTVRVGSLSAGGAVRLPFSLDFQARGTVRASSPSRDSQLWMAPWSGRSLVSWQHRFFRGDLLVTMGLRAVFAGPRSTQQGEVATSDRYDFFGTVTLASATFHFLLQNLEDDVTPAAAYEGGWVPLPYRSYRMGLTWRFLD